MNPCLYGLLVKMAARGLGTVRIGHPPYARKIACDISCVGGQTPQGIISEVFLPDINATITLSMEGSSYYKRLELRPRHTRHASRSFLGTTNLNSDVPMPYYNWPWTQFMDAPPKLSTKLLWSYNYIQIPPPPFHSTAPKALFLAKNCNSDNGRENVARTLQRYGVPLDSPGPCITAGYSFDPSDLVDKNALMRKYRVYFAFENQNTNDYVTEKLWGAYASGTIPVYYGAPNIRSLIPPESAILVQTFPTLKAAAQEINAALTSPSVNARYHRWRFKPLPLAFVKTWNFTHVHSECRLCRFVSQQLELLK